MSGPLFMNDPYTTTSSVVDYYHLLPYKEILFDCLHRKWPSDSSISAPKEQSHRNGKYSLHSEIDENLEEQEANSKSKMQKPTTKVSTQKKNKQTHFGYDKNVICLLYSMRILILCLRGKVAF